MAKKKPDPINELVSEAADAVCVRMTEAPPGVVGAPGVGVSNLSPEVIRKLAEAAIKNSIELAIKFGGGSLEDLAESQRETLARLVPDEFYLFIERLAHKMHGGNPHMVGDGGQPMEA